MSGRTTSSVLVVVALALGAPGCKPSWTVRENAATAAEAELEPTSKTIFGERILLFLEYPHIVQGEAVRFLAHLSVLATGEAIRAGTVSLEIGATKLAVERPKREGLFIPEGSLAAAGRFSARLVVTSEQARETLDLGEIVVHATRDEARQAAEGEAGDPPVGAAPFLMEQQWKVKLLLATAAPRALARRLVLPAQARWPEGAEAVVAAPLAGRLVAPPSGALPRSGDVVEAGQVLGFVEPPLGASELSQLQALALEFDLKTLEVVRTLTEAKARVAFATRESDRIVRLREKGLSTQQQVDEAERDLALARSDEESSRATKESLDRLIEARRASGGDANRPSLRLPVIAPLRGTLVSAGRVTGESVAAGDVLFRVFDGARAWAEGRASEFDLPLVRGALGGTVTFAALPGMRFDADAGGDPARAFVLAPNVDPTSRTLVVRCSIANPDGAIRAGMLGEIALAVARVESAVAIPAEAVVMDQGAATTYVMLEGELFQKRELELGIRDGDFVEVRRGVAPGERVATRGAYVVKLAAMSPASFGPGHQH